VTRQSSLLHDGLFCLICFGVVILCSRNCSVKIHIYLAGAGELVNDSNEFANGNIYATFANWLIFFRCLILSQRYFSFDL
jgi:hypothetical protein